MKDNAPDVKNVKDVKHKHPEGYIQYIRKNGKYAGTIEYQRGGKTLKYTAQKTLSTHTITQYINTLKHVFQVLSVKTGMVVNPCENIKQLKQERTAREVFTEEDLILIQRGFKTPNIFGEFCEPLFTIALNTGLREGDICTLKWSDISFKEDGWITRRMNKTGRTVDIPMINGMYEYLSELRNNAEEGAEYVLPEHEEMYRKNKSGVSYRIKHFLSGCGVNDTNANVVEGKRRVSVKDLHSGRHVFAFRGMMCGIPLTIIEAVLGHVDEEMTKRYMQHSNRADIRKHLSGLAVLPAPEDDIVDVQAVDVTADRVTAQNILNNMTDEEIAEFVRKYQKKLQ